MKKISVILFNDYTSLDALGPAEVFARMKETYQLDYFSVIGGTVKSSINTEIVTKKMSEIEENGILLIPGGFGTRKLSEDYDFASTLKKAAEKSEFVLTVCTGSALLSKTGLLDGKKATSNKIAWDWVISQNEKVCWQKKARWCVDGKFYTSSGVSAGIDMALGFISDMHGRKKALECARGIEYIWNSDKNKDDFC